MSAKTGINYPDLEPGNKFWNRVRVPGSCYKSLAPTAAASWTDDDVSVELIYHVDGAVSSLFATAL